MIEVQSGQTVVAVMWYLGIGFVIGAIVGIVAERRGRTFGVWYAFGVVAFPIAMAVLLLLPDLLRTPCPKCSRQVMRTARRCPHCGEFMPVTPANESMPVASGNHLLEVNDLVMHFPIRGTGLLRRVVGHVQAVSNVTLHVDEGETLGIVGESGCGKSTTGRAILQLHRPTAGSVHFDGQELTILPHDKMQDVRRDLQIVFQDPYASLNPKMPVNDIIAEPMKVHGVYDKGGKERVAELLRLVGLNPEHGNRYPHEFSGGQRQRIGIARALALQPKALVLDEPVSALDVSVQAGIINLLEELQDQFGLAYLFIAHDLSVVRHISDRVAVMYLGKVVETGPRDNIYTKPSHPYTQALLSAVPAANPQRERERQRIMLTGDVPSPVDPPSGCRFRTRCWKAEEICATDEPLLEDRGAGHPVACHFAEVVQTVV